MDQVVCAHPPLSQCPTTYIVHGFPRTVSDGFLQKLISSLRIYIHPLPEIQIFCIIHNFRVMSITVINDIAKYDANGDGSNQ